MKTLSESERRRIIGDYVAPQGYYDKTKAMPFLGKVTCHADRIVAGSWHEIVLDYEVGASGLADGAWMKATFKFYSDWALFQTSDPRAANYVSAEYQAGPLLPGQEPATVHLGHPFDAGRGICGQVGRQWATVEGIQPVRGAGPEDDGRHSQPLREAVVLALDVPEDQALGPEGGEAKHVLLDQPGLPAARDTGHVHVGVGHDALVDPLDRV